MSRNSLEEIERLRAVLASDPAAYRLNVMALAQRLYFRGLRVKAPRRRVRP